MTAKPSGPQTYSLPKAASARLKLLFEQANAAGRAYQQEMGAAFVWLSIPDDIELSRVQMDFDKGTLTVLPPG